MPTVVDPIHLEITSAEPDWYIVSDDAVSSPLMGVTSPPREFWDTAVVSWEGGDFDDLWIQTYGGLGWTNFFIWPASANGAALSSLMSSGNLDTMAGNYRSREDVDNPATLGGLRWQLRTGSSMPVSILIEGDFDYTHETGRDPDPVLHAPYIMRTVEGDDVSTWSAPPGPRVRDNEQFVGGIVYTGIDHDAGDSQYYTLTVYDRELVVGDITGEYLGSDRRFMGF